MVHIRYAQRELLFSIVYYGAPSVGKKTNLFSLVDSLSDSYRSDLIRDTLDGEQRYSLEYHPLSVESIAGGQWEFQVRARLQCLSEDKSNRKARKLLLKGVDGIIFVADSRRDRQEQNLSWWDNLYGVLWEYYRVELAAIPVIIQLNQRKDHDNVTEEELRQTLLDFSRQQRHLDHKSYQHLSIITGDVKANQKVIDTVEQSILQITRSFDMTI